MPVLRYVNSSGVEQVLEYLRSERRLVRFIFAGHIADARPLVSSNTPTDEPSSPFWAIGSALKPGSGYDTSSPSKFRRTVWVGLVETM
jgi:hypothetical protein